MARSLAFFLIYFLIFLPNLVFATPESKALRDVIQAQVDIRTTCTLTVSSGNDILLKSPRSLLGNGYFIEHSIPHLVKTAGHVVDCSLSEQAIRNIKLMFSNIPVISIGINTSISVVYRNKEYPAKVLKYSFGENKPDYAVLLAVEIPESVGHYSLPLILEDGIYEVGDEAVISGQLPFGEAGKEREWYLKKVLIAKLNNQVIKFSEVVYSGLSGAPLLYYYNGKYHAIGTIVRGWGVDVYGINIPLDAAEAVKLQKKFFDIDAKTAPN